MESLENAPVEDKATTQSQAITRTTPKVSETASRKVRPGVTHKLLQRQHSRGWASTYGILRESCMFDIRLVAEGRHSCEVPAAALALADTANAHADSTHKLDGNLLVVQEIGAFEYDAERTLADLLADAVVDAYDIGRRRGHGSGIARRYPRLQPGCGEEQYAVGREEVLLRDSRSTGLWGNRSRSGL